MAVAGFRNDNEFSDVLNNYLSPSSPIRTIELLRGRSDVLEQIVRDLRSTGRHVFIYGERGVGKTSLALTAAYLRQSADQDPIYVACQGRTTLYGIVEDVASRLLANDPVGGRTTTSYGAQAGLPGLTAGMQRMVEDGNVPEVGSINEAALLLMYAAQRHSASPVVIIDEFDQVGDDHERAMFADLIKQLGDQEIPLKIIFCGIGTSVTALLKAHESCYRYISSKMLDPLGWDARLEIIQSASSAVGVTIDRDTTFRIAAISDGFPHYVHLLTSQLLWTVFDDPATISKARLEHYREAVKRAVSDIQPQLRETYEVAIQKYKDDYEEVLWAVADHHEFQRRSTDCYNSYVELMRRRPGREPLDRAKFNGRMNRLKSPAARSILSGTRAGWYQFSEPIMRGYVRLRAENAGVKLITDHPHARRVASSN